jgi:hypothetical protein
VKFRNKETGVTVEPASDLAAQTFVNSLDWEQTDKAMKTKSAGVEPPKTVDSMTSSELKALAETLGLAVEASAKKADLVAAIKAAQANPGSDDGGGTT